MDWPGVAGHGAPRAKAVSAHAGGPVVKEGALYQRQTEG